MIDPVTLLKDYHAELNNFDLGRVERMFAEDAIYISPGLNGAIKGRLLIMAGMQKYFAEYTNQVSRDEAIVQVSDYVVRSDWILDATSNISGLHIHRSGIEFVTFDRNGSIRKIEVHDLGVISRS